MASAVWRYVDDVQRGAAWKREAGWGSVGRGRGGHLSGGPGFWMEAGTEARRRAGTGTMLLSLGLMGQALVPLWGNRSDLEGGKAAGRRAGWPARPQCNVQCCTRLSAAFHLGLCGGRLSIDLCPKNDSAGPGTHRLLYSHCLQGCWSSCGPWWRTPRTPRRGYSLCSPCPRPSQHPLGSGDPARKERGSKVVLTEPVGSMGNVALHLRGRTVEPCGTGLTWDGGTRSKFFPSILRMCFRACEVIWCLRRKENWQPSRMQWK